jgi:hypothetical protein
MRRQGRPERQRTLQCASNAFSKPPGSHFPTRTRCREFPTVM